MNYYPHHIGDFNNATRHLTRVERSLYRDLMDLYYDTEQPLPASDLPWICKKVLATSSAEKEAVKSILKEFFTLDGDLYHHSRCDREITAYRTKQEGAIKAGRASAESRLNRKSTTVERPLNDRATNQNHKPEPTTKNQNQEPENPKVKPSSPGVEKPTPRRVNGHEAPTVETWNAYSAAYQHRWGVEPTRNKTVNGQLGQFVTRVPATEAPEIAAFYVGSNRGLYVAAKHPTNLLLRDAEALRTEWLTGKQGTETEARQADRAQSTGNSFAPLIAEAEARERLPDVSQ